MRTQDLSRGVCNAEEGMLVKGQDIDKITDFPGLVLAGTIFADWDISTKLHIR